MRPDEHLAAILTAEAAGRQTEFLFFWATSPSVTAPPAPAALSQWWPAPFTVDGVAYPTAEHWMIAGRARLFRDDQALAAVLAAEDPKTAKAAGRSVRGFGEQAWAAARFDLVVDGNLAKFAHNPDLGAFLAATRPRVLVEASPRDRIWGIGMTAAHPDATRPSCWRGTNLLEFALMNVRDQL
jgi:ribA/ribD-fused uncharacterized protein